MIVKSLDEVFNEVQKDNYKFVLPLSTEFLGCVLMGKKSLNQYMGVSVKKSLNENVRINYGGFLTDGEGWEISSLVGFENQDLDMKELFEFGSRLGKAKIRFLTNLVKESSIDSNTINSCEFFDPKDFEGATFRKILSRAIYAVSYKLPFSRGLKKQEIIHDYYSLRSLAWKVLDLSSTESLSFLQGFTEDKNILSLKKFYSEVKRISSNSYERFFRFVENKNEEEKAILSKESFLPENFENIASYLLNPNALGKEF